MAVGKLSGTAPSTGLVLMLAEKDASAIASLRLAADVEVAEADGTLWLRARNPDAAVQTGSANLPAIERFEWLQDDRLRRLGSLLACDRLPPLQWQPIASWARIQLPRFVSPAETDSDPEPPSGIRITLGRSAQEVAPNALLTTLTHWSRFGAEAPALRFHGLQFAANDAGQVFVAGEILPPLPGKYYSVRDGMAVPAGFAVQPSVEPEMLRQRLGIPAGSLLIFFEDGSFTSIHVEQWVSATRSAILATGAEVNVQ